MRRGAALVELTLVRYREFRREPEAVFWVFIFPLLLTTGLGIAFRNRPTDIVNVGVAAGRPGTEQVRAALEADHAMTVEVIDDSAAARGLRIGRLALVVVPEGPGQVTYRFDDTRPDARTARFLVDDALQRGAGRHDPVASREDLVREPGSRYIDFVLPGLLGLNLLGSGVWGIGFSVVDARRKRLLKRFLATPMSKWEYLASFVVSRLTLLIIEVTLLLGFGMLVFQVPLRGSIITLALTCLLAALCFGGLGLLIAARPTTIEGASGIMNVVMMPQWIFSGVFFASNKFPAVAQPFIKALPLTAVVDALRGIMLEGVGLVGLMPELAVIVVWAIVSFSIALLIFRWK
jgi:ABC-type multidrug transport system permease subunit